jgi:hypothetical protein
MMTFDSLDAVREFGGDDYEAAVVPFDLRSLHPAALIPFSGRLIVYR